MAGIDFISWGSSVFFLFFIGIISRDRPAMFRQIPPSTAPYYLCQSVRDMQRHPPPPPTPTSSLFLLPLRQPAPKRTYGGDSGLDSTWWRLHETLSCGAVAVHPVIVFHENGSLQSSLLIGGTVSHNTWWTPNRLRTSQIAIVMSSELTGGILIMDLSTFSKSQSLSLSSFLLVFNPTLAIP